MQQRRNLSALLINYFCLPIWYTLVLCCRDERKQHFKIDKDQQDNEEDNRCAFQKNNWFKIVLFNLQKDMQQKWKCKKLTLIFV